MSVMQEVTQFLSKQRASEVYFLQKKGRAVHTHAQLQICRKTLRGMAIGPKNKRMNESFVYCPQLISMWIREVFAPPIFQLAPVQVEVSRLDTNGLRHTTGSIESEVDEL